MSNKFRRETICVQGGYTPKSGEARVVPIYQSTTFKYGDSSQMGGCSIWRKTATFIPGWQTPPATR